MARCGGLFLAHGPRRCMRRVSMGGGAAQGEAMVTNSLLATAEASNEMSVT